MLVATVFIDYATVAGGLAGSIAVMGFVFQAVPVFKRANENRVRQITAVGGLFGLVIGIAVLILSATR